MDDIIDLLRQARAAAATHEKDAFIDEALARLEGDQPALTWAEQEVMMILANRGATPGRSQSLQGLWHAWGTKGTNADFADAVKGLQEKGFVSLNDRQTDVTVTDKGYQLIS